MPLFKRNKDQIQIPPVPNPVSDKSTTNSKSSLPSYKSHAATYVPSRDGDPYNFPKSTPVSTPEEANELRDKYSRNNGVGDIYSRGGAEIERDRNELFAGFNPQKAGTGRLFDGPQPGESGQEEEDVEGIKTQTRFMKQESVNSTRNALRMAREAEETARNTLTRLGDQSEKMANTERHLDIAKGHTLQAADKTDELKQLNRSIFRPVITFNKDAKRAAQQAKLHARYEDERIDREKAMMDIRDTQNRLGRATTYGRDNDESVSGRRLLTTDQQAARKEQRKRFQFEATASDDEMEDEIDTNLDEIGDTTKRLKALAMGMGQELDTQNKRIDRIENKAVSLDQKVFMNTERLKRIK
ncbi:hypothetical protein AMATHDRAFT_72295 [Amanita thiersii Skay4041]|uniref:t-SNARE coiled-coil homology domain-containing protein n=1 Tax=Amanita thiersii Skay4041 TaxID=703135 RepID=A0A2A9P0I6_9AGAR|nr:hypothetical protein AMATHDRAFT_72295 [Amanita thiersii Skay4041]